MLRCNKLVLALCLVSVALVGLIGKPANAGNWGNGHGNNNYGTHLSLGHGYGVNQNFGFQPYHGQNFRRQVNIVHTEYRVLVRQPNRFHDWDWHRVNTFGSHYSADQHASFLDSQFHGENGFAVKVVQYNW